MRASRRTLRRQVVRQTDGSADGSEDASELAVADGDTVDVPSWTGHAPVVWEVELGPTV
ncbi:MAG: hypothetical protein ACXV3A_01225 [Kineosporiaceae bacterium]